MIYLRKCWEWLVLFHAASFQETVHMLFSDSPCCSGFEPGRPRLRSREHPAMSRSWTLWGWESSLPATFAAIRRPPTISTRRRQRRTLNRFQRSLRRRRRLRSDQRQRYFPFLNEKSVISLWKMKKRISRRRKEKAAELLKIDLWETQFCAFRSTKGAFLMLFGLFGGLG